MDLISKNDLLTLAAERAEACVSIFMPTHRMGRETQQDPIRLKNLLDEASNRLQAQGMRTIDIKNLLEPGQLLVEDEMFWQHQAQGLALFLSSDSFLFYRLSLEFEALVVVGERFHLKPLMPLLSGNGRFYILALSQNEVRLLQGTRETVAQVELEDVPESLAEALKYDDPEKQQQYHTQTSSGGGRRAAIFHGQGVGVDDENTNIFRFFQQVNKGLQDILSNQTAPLILAGVEFLHPFYQQANSYNHLLPEGIIGNPDEWSAEELHRWAWEILEPYFQQAQEEALAQYANLAHTAEASSDSREIIPAAHYGRIKTLFVATGIQQWGTFDEETDTLNLHQNPEAGDGDLLDATALQTLLNGGTVYAVDPERVPGSKSLAAIFRYAK
jgi:hypothetical protein